jgi:hypothetical protein
MVVQCTMCIDNGTRGDMAGFEQEAHRVFFLPCPLLKYEGVVRYVSFRHSMLNLLITL